MVGSDVEAELLLVHAVTNAVALLGHRTEGAPNNGRRGQSGGGEDVGVQQLVGYKRGRRGVS